MNSEHAPVEADLLGARKLAGCQRTSSCAPTLRDEHAERAADDASTRLSVKSCRITRAVRAECDANRQLAFTCRGAREQQAREIHRGDEQHEADGAEQHEQAGADLADDRVAQRRD